MSRSLGRLEAAIIPWLADDEDVPRKSDRGPEATGMGVHRCEELLFGRGASSAAHNDQEQADHHCPARSLPTATAEVDPVVLALGNGHGRPPVSAKLEIWRGLSRAGRCRKR
jgi:hypothetical protein